MFCVEVTHVIPYGYMSAWRGVCSYVCALRGRWCARAYTHLVHTAEVLDGGLDRVETRERVWIDQEAECRVRETAFE